MLLEAIKSKSDLYVSQKKEWGEILVGYESANKYVVMDEGHSQLGAFFEEGKGFISFIARFLLRSHRPLQVAVLELTGEKVLHLSRRFFFFFSDLEIKGKSGQSIGSVHRRFGIFYKKYDLKDNSGMVFATIKSPFWRLWTFPIFDQRTGQANGEISKKWGGVVKEMFTDTDTFRVSFGQGYSAVQRTVIFAASVSIDFDFFEENANRGGLLGIGN
jgi:uncharacterized protein YxjI